MRIVGILLAAGRGTRFGGDKLLAALKDGTPIGVRSASNLRSALADTIAVVRSEDDALAALLEAAGIEVTRCPDAHLGMGASLAHAVRARPDAGGWIVALADMPLVQPETIRKLAAALQAGAWIAAPRHAGRRGNPVGFASGLKSRLAALSGDVGARDIVREDASRVVFVDVDDSGVLADIDTRAELEQLPERRAE